MNILLLGSGGREHALAWKISQSKKCSQLFIAPGNAGTSQCGTNVNISATDFPSIKKFCLDHKIEIVIVGPEDPLVKGIHNFFLEDDQLKKIPVIGPTKDGAQLEGSKDFAKAFMQRHGIPTAAYRSFTKEELPAALDFLNTLKSPYVLKADGLAAGKGVVIAQSLEEAKQELTEMLAHSRFGQASNKVVVEEFLKGIELSIFVLTDGVSYKILPEAKDYKRIGENDTGPNTGGMGAVSPVPFADKTFLDKVEKRIILSTIEGLRNEGITYKGFVFIGLMNCDGDPYVIEYNCRMGDPETEVVIPRIKTDLVELFEAIAQQKLSERNIETDRRTVITVMMVSDGYPGEYEKGKIISGFEDVKESIVFHAGTMLNDQEKVISSGGRVLAVTSYGNSIAEARALSYKSISKISFEKMYFRKDIGEDLIRYET